MLQPEVDGVAQRWQRVYHGSNPLLTTVSLAEQSPADYLLYYKRATAYLSLQRHPLALQDFQHVLELTNTPPPAVHLQIARIYAKSGQFAAARSAARTYTAVAGGGGSSAKDANDLLFQISEAEMAWKKAEGAKRAGLWTACVEAASLALQVATHSPEVRETRAECGVAGGDIELAVGDLGCVTIAMSKMCAC